MISRVALTVAGLLLCCGTVAAAQQIPSKPNVILIMVDDFGYECIGANGSTSYQTPHVDRLAQGGMRFEHCYSQPLCTPTRVQLMTGQYNIRNYVRFGYLDPKQTTFAHQFKRAGYTTGIVGKWQLGGGFDGPKHFGFDEYCLWQLTRRPPRFANPGLEINGKEVVYNQGEYGPELVNNYALDFVTRHKDQPFLLYYPMILTHSPFQPTPDSPDWDPKAEGEKVHRDDRHFGEMVNYMDKMVGRLVARLDELKLRERTLIIFIGDNGTGKGIVSKLGDVKVDGGKGQMDDNGMRVPLVVNWPGVVPAGKVSRDLVDSTDHFPTICQAAGIPLSAELNLDGQSYYPQLRGEKGRPREWTYCWYAPNQGKVNKPRQFARTQRYKLYGDGRFVEVDSQRFTERKLSAAELPSEAVAARQKLAEVLESFQNARPKDLAALEKNGVENKR
jgi:arylsulfatase A